MITIALWAVFLFFLNGALAYWVPFVATAGNKGPFASNQRPHPTPAVFFRVLIPCHNGAASLPGLLKCLDRQDYPKGCYRVLVLADNCSDDSARVARSFGVDVYERQDPERMGKTYALNEVLEKRLRQDVFDALVVFDVDSRVDETFLSSAAGRLEGGDVVLQGAPYSKNPNQNEWTELGDAIQALVRAHQAGCAALGLYPIPMGGFGTTIPRTCLDRLDWHMADDPTADDLEFEIRCCLHRIPVRYAEELRVFHELPDDSDIVRHQRRRWISNPLRLAPQYGLSLLSSALTGNWKASQFLFGFLLCPSFSLLFLGLGASTVALGVFSFWHAKLLPWTLTMAGLWVMHGIYLLLALRRENVSVSWRQAGLVPRYLWEKTRSLAEGILFIRSKEWLPTPHKSDEEMGFVQKKSAPGKEQVP